MDLATAWHRRLLADFYEFALRLWLASDSTNISHARPDLQPDHPHLLEHASHGEHRHLLIMDDLQRSWPRE
ncbi:hypothetical protein [Candidimonas sp. SYP-B2681]|uniref:hypothetical protein n=1 Tax=Candidimonas sp. SYP-B2681 TaxID=2497686 RepID=UPI0018F3D5B6|nr:hypothetical protein [Candidimonas sp. SYP-B2681]